MKRTLALGATASLLVAFVLGCYEPTAPEAPQYLLLSGVWSAIITTPGGYYIRIATFAEDGRITGAGVAYTLSGTDTLKVGGQYSADGSFELSVAFASGRSATYTGVVRGTGALTGTWTDWSTGRSYNTTFTRVPVPPCSDSVPLLGTYDPAAPGFIVRFQDTVDATTETARLGALYGFAADHVYDVAIKGFAADIPLTTVTVLRCEPKVTQIEYDGRVTIAGPEARR